VAGTFVRSSLRRSATGWEIAGVLTKGQTDTFLFTIFNYPAPLDLAAADGLAVTLTTPAGQETSTNLLVFMKDRDGRQCYANSARSLSQPGTSHLLIPWSIFEPWGSESRATGPFDRAHVVGINVGWGGYFGTEGEKVEFTLSPLEAVALGP
jgi:hypothetical protein